MPLASRVSFLIGVLLVCAFLLASRPHWYSEVEREVAIATEPLESDPLDISRVGTTTWEVPKRGWILQKGQAQVSLVFEQDEDVPVDRYDPKRLELRARMTAFGELADGTRVDRKVVSEYYRPDQGAVPGGLWSSRFEHGIGAVLIYPREKLFVSFEVVAPDPVLQSSNPRLRIVGEHDYAAVGHASILRLFRDVGLGTCILLLVSMAVMYWKVSRYAERAG